MQEKKFKLYCSWRIYYNVHYGKVILIISFQNSLLMEHDVHPEAKTDCKFYQSFNYKPCNR